MATLKPYGRSKKQTIEKLLGRLAWLLLGLAFYNKSHREFAPRQQSAVGFCVACLSLLIDDVCRYFSVACTY